MLEWKLDSRPFKLSEGRDRASDVDHGWRFRAVNTTGEQMTIRIMQVRGRPGTMSERSARQAVTPYLNDVKPPSTLILCRDGRVRPAR